MAALLYGDWKKSQTATVVGVVPDTRYRDLRDARASIYVPLRQSFFPFVPTALGIIGALLANRLLASLLYEVTPTDAVTLVAVAGSLLAVASLATFIPARSSTRIDPAIALRVEG